MGKEGQLHSDFICVLFIYLEHVVGCNGDLLAAMDKIKPNKGIKLINKPLKILPFLDQA